MEILYIKLSRPKQIFYTTLSLYYTVLWQDQQLVVAESEAKKAPKRAFPCKLCDALSSDKDREHTFW